MFPGSVRTVSAPKIRQLSTLGVSGVVAGVVVAGKYADPVPLLSLLSSADDVATPVYS
jgi:hypothetical protein